MTWEETQLVARGAAIPEHPAAYYRRKGVRARQAAEEVTTRALKARLFDEALLCEQLAAEADRLEIE